MQRRLRTLADHPLVGEVRGVGLIAAVELVAGKATRKAFPDGRVGAHAQMRAQEQGLITRAVAGSSLAICPPLVISEAEVDELVEMLGRAIDQTHDFARLQGLMD